MNRILATAAFLITIGTACFSSDIPTTNWGAVLKVPLDKVEEVENRLIEWGNWIKETHPMGDEEMGLDSLTITKGDATKTHVYYVVVERYRTVDGLRNHQKQFRKDSNADYASLLGNLGFFSQYRVYKSEQRKTVFSIIP